MKLKDSKTYLNLAKAFAGESQAHVRYMFIEYGARKEGYKAMAELIDKVAYQEFTHARMLYTFIQTADEGTIDNIDIASGYPFKEKWNLLDNLRLAAEDEKFEAQKIYPEYAETARAEGFDDIAGLFGNLVQIETCHKLLFAELYDQMKSGTLYKKDKAVKWKCPACGYEEVLKECFAECPVCHEKRGAALLKINDGE